MSLWRSGAVVACILVAWGSTARADPAPPAATDLPAPTPPPPPPEPPPMPPAATPAVMAPAPPSSSVAPGSRVWMHHTVPRYAYIAGGVAAGSLAVALAFGIARLPLVSQLNRECGASGQYCPDSAHGDVNLVDAETILADVFAGVGVASALTTGVLIQFAPMAPSSRGAGSGLGALVVGSF